MRDRGLNDEPVNITNSYRSGMDIEKNDLKIK